MSHFSDSFYARFEYSREKQHKFDLEIMRRGHFRILITRPIDDFVNIIM
jgi:hypothetical protein